MAATVMPMNLRKIFPGVALLACFVSEVALAQEVRVAVATNFKSAMERIAEEFEAETGHEVLLSFGSTGKHYAQIRNGAPFDLFLAADVNRPRRLEEEGVAVAGSRFTYAVGRLALWSRESGLIDQDGAVLHSEGFRYVAIANPDLAPYGRAAREVLEALGLVESLRLRTVRGENVGQAFAFVRSGNAELGFVAFAQVAGLPADAAGSVWVVPSELYSPIEQQAVLLEETAAARALLEFLRGSRARAIIRESGYGGP